MIKINALNDDTDEESGSEEEVTKEALEQIALKQYTKALDLQRNGKLKDATQLLKDLLDTELLYDIKKPLPGEKVSGPLFNLKYLCLKNLAGMLSSADDVEPAIEAYCAASELDDTDITLWHKLGELCLRVKRYEKALHAFQRGAERNPRHWPCLDKIVTLLLGLDNKVECICAIHEALQLDPGYLRGLAYRKHIYTVYPYFKDFMEYLDPTYKWDPTKDFPIDEKEAEKLLKEANEIHETFLAQQKDLEFKYVMPNLKLKKPINNLNWSSVGDSLVHMHNFMTENYFSHACYVELVYEKETEVPMEVCEDPNLDQLVEKQDDNNIDTARNLERNIENVSENEMNELSNKDKPVNDTEKIDSDVEVLPSDTALDNQSESKLQKKAPVRRRGSALSFLQQWEWCTKRRSGRKKPVNRQDFDDNIYDTLRRMVPLCLSVEDGQSKDPPTKETSPEIGDPDKPIEDNVAQTENFNYFNTDDEQRDVKDFIAKYTDNKGDIIDMLRNFLSILAEKWKMKWPENLIKVFIEANKCYNNHIDIPSYTDENDHELLHYTAVNILVEEFKVNDKLNLSLEDKDRHEINVIETIGMIITMRPNIFKGTDCLEFMLRYLWCKLHIHILNKCEEFALDCLYQLFCEFEVMGEDHDKYSLNLINFTFKPIINENVILETMKFLERNKKLSTVMDFYERGSYDEVLPILIDSFEYCKNMARNQEEEMSLDFAAQLSLILDTYWALDNIDECFKSCITCLHEALKHYFRCTSGSPDYIKWTLTVLKILCSMEHILSTEGLGCLDSVPRNELSQGLDDLIRIIGHQVETNATEMPIKDTVAPWIIMHYILQREEDQGRARSFDKDKVACDEVPNSLLVLFIAHEQLGSRGWCCKSNARLLYFILDTVVPRLRSPALAKALEQICQYMEQCVYCLFGHPAKKSKLKYLVDHNVTPHTLDWKRAQQLYEIFRPPVLPALEGKVPAITPDTEQLFQRILALLPSEYDLSKYVPEIDKYIKGVVDDLPSIPTLLPYKMKDIYFLLGDFHFKREEGKLAIKYNMLDVLVNNSRLESWAEISLAKAVNLERLLNSCKNLNNEREYLNPAKSIIRCFKRSLALDPTHSNMWVEYGIFVYTVHSFCSRLLKQASESLSMEDFESLEKQKEDMLVTTQKCFNTVLNHLNNSNESEKENEESWLYFYMLGKVAEKQNKPPSVYLNYYMKGVKCLQDTDATYPLKINYSSPTHLCIEVLELHYRIHASILKYIEQHENKPIPTSVGKVFVNCIENWKKGPFNKKYKKDGALEMEVDTTKPTDNVHPANIFKRSISDAGEDDNFEMKRLKLEAAAAKVRRSASYDTERLPTKEPGKKTEESTDLVAQTGETKQSSLATVNENKVQIQDVEKAETTDNNTLLKKDTDKSKRDETSSATSSSSSSESSSSGCSSDSTSESSRDSDSTKSVDNTKPLTDEEIMNIVSACLDALEDCASRFPPHYKAIYRLAHYHFYYKKGKDIERCRDLMLLNFTSRSGPKLGGLFSERKHSNFFNNIWKFPVAEVERAGGFAFHMSRCILLTMEILKEIDDHKTLLDLSLYLQRIPDLDKKYLRDSDREELAQQAFSLCVQSLKGQLTKFSQQADLKSNEVEKQALNSLLVDIYKAYQRSQKQPNSKQFTNLIIDGYKLATTETHSENTNFVDISMKYCQKLKQEATQASLDKSQNTQKKQIAAKVTEPSKPSTSTFNVSKADPKPPTTTSTSSALPKISAHEMASAFQNYLPMLNDPMLSQQTAAALSLSYLSNMSALAGYTSLQNSLQSSLQSSLQNSFQAEFYRQFLGQSMSSYMPPKKMKRAPKQVLPKPLKASKSFTSATSVTKAIPTPVISSLQKSTSAPLTPSMGTVLSTLPPSMAANLSSFGGTSHSSSHTTLPNQAHMASSSSINAALHSKPPKPHQQVSPGKTLQEKLAAKQKHLPMSKAQEITASISKLPSSLTITKTTIPKPMKKPEAKRVLPICGERPKPITSDEVIVLDDD